MTPPLLVVMPVYNASLYLRQAIESILCQSFQDFQFFIINDGSTDDSEKIARSFIDKRIVVVDQPNSGPGAAMNRALEYACNAKIPFLARMDADDISHDDRFATQISLLDSHSNAAAISSNCYYIDADTAQTIGTSTVSTEPWLIRWEIQHGLRGLIQGACLFRTNALAQIGGYRSQFKLAEEADLFLRLAEQFELVNSSAYLYSIRLRTDSISMQNVHRNVLFQFYALDCCIHRRQGRPERDFVSFQTSPGLQMLYRIWREENVLRLWRGGMGKNGIFSILAAAFLDPRRVIVRGLRKL